jgi:mono/diheme cytochrome c family protein
MSTLPRVGITIGVLVLGAALGLVLRLALGSPPTAPTSHGIENYTGILPVDLLRQPIPDTAPNAQQLRRGQYLVAAGDCMSCHLRDGGEPLAG